MGREALYHSPALSIPVLYRLVLVSPLLMPAGELSYKVDPSILDFEGDNRNATGRTWNNHEVV
jgi:hypothetical protein